MKHSLKMRVNRSLRTIEDMKATGVARKADLTYLENTIRMLDEQDPVTEIEEALRSQLGDSYGGPSLSVAEHGPNKGKFVIYKWTDMYDADTVVKSCSSLMKLIGVKRR